MLKRFIFEVALAFSLNSFLSLVFNTTITVSSLYGHYTDMRSGAYMAWPLFVDTGPGFSQLEVAP